MRAARGTPSVAWVPPTTSARRVKVMPLEASVMGGFLRGIGWELSAFQAEIVKLSGQTQEQRNEQHRNDDLRRDEAEQAPGRSEEHTSELQSLMRSSYAVFCLKKKKQ